MHRYFCILLASTALVLSACDQHPQPSRPAPAATPVAAYHPKPVYSRIYADTSGREYTRTWHQNTDGTGDFWFWMWVLSSNNSNSSSVGSDSGSWSRVQAVPAGAVATPRVVTDKEGEPTEEFENAAAVPAAGVIDEETTPTEAETAATATEPTDAESGDGGNAPAPEPEAAPDSTSGDTAAPSSDTGGTTGGDSGGASGGDGGSSGGGDGGSGD